MFMILCITVQVLKCFDSGGRPNESVLDLFKIPPRTNFLGRSHPTAELERLSRH